MPSRSARPEPPLGDVHQKNVLLYCILAVVSRLISVEHLKKNLILALGFGVAVYLIFALLSGLDYLLNALGGFHWSLLALISGLIATSYALRFARWSYYLKLLKVSLPLQMNVTIFAAGLSMTI